MKSLQTAKKVIHYTRMKTQGRLFLPEGAAGLSRYNRLPMESITVF